MQVQGQTKVDWSAVSFVITQLACYALINGLSYRFVHQQQFQQRPIITVIILLLSCFVFQMISLRRFLHYTETKNLGMKILVIACLMRAILFFSSPIQEIDFYRYLWDGFVTLQGENPYKFSPEQQLAQLHLKTTSQSQLIHDLTATQQTILERIHFGQYITIYPPVSQAVFATTVSLIPENSSLTTYIYSMRLMITLFDLGTALLLWWLLSLTRKHPAWLISYAWSPLVLKELTNSIHLDSIAIFFSFLAICLWVKYFSAPHKFSLLCYSSISLALAVGAKIFPLVLLPIMTLRLFYLKQWCNAAYYFTATLFTSLVILSPMILTKPHESLTDSATQSTERGLTAFIQHWEMNDLCFMFVYENLNTQSSMNHWFKFIPQSWSLSILESCSNLPQGIQLDAFQMTRLFLLLMYTLLISRHCYRLFFISQRQNNSSESHCENPDHQWLCLLFLTLAWFWIISPTQNPWYWLWALPLIPYTKLRSWHLIAGVLPLYYLRFYCLYHLSDDPSVIFTYQGEEIFHYLLSPLEHSLWMIPLVAEYCFIRITTVTHKT